MQRSVPPSLPELTLDLFREAAGDFAETLREKPFPDLYGASDGKAVGTRIESLFKHFLEDKFDVQTGNAARGLDFPSLNTDLKVTSLRQPQSSSPFKSASQKVYGLGYNLLIIVYTKKDDLKKEAAFFEIHHVVFVDKKRTSDYTLTKSILDILKDSPQNEIAVEEVDALLQDKNVPLDEIGRRELAERIVQFPPEQGYLTISNALQWRLQYSRAIHAAVSGIAAPTVLELKHAQ